MKNTDLHTHSYYSDGSLSPKELVRLAKKRCIRSLALTDHSSIRGVKEAIREGNKIGVRVIPAVEIRADDNEVLGYFIDLNNRELKKGLKEIQKRMVDMVKKMVIKINKKGIKLKFSNLTDRYKPNKNFIEAHAISYLKEKGYGSFSELWKRYASEHAETYVPVKEISTIKAIRLIKKAGGVPILAHPWVNRRSKRLLQEVNFKKLIKAGLKGIEIDNGDRFLRRDKKTIARIKQLAKKYNLIVTAGSDFHKSSRVKRLLSHNLGKTLCDEKVIGELEKLR